MEVSIKQIEQDGCLEIFGVQIAESFVGANRFDKGRGVDGREAEFVFDGLGTSFGIGLGCDPGEEGWFLGFRFIGNEVNIEINDQMVFRFFLS